MVEHVYGDTVADFAPGDRVELHPATDLWMRGARFATVVSVHPKGGYVAVDMDPATRLRKRRRLILPDSLRKL